MITSNRNQKINIFFRVALLTLAGSFIYAMYSGVRNNYGIMLNSIVESSGISFSSVSFVLAIGQFIFGLVQPAFGILAAKKGNWIVFISGVTLTVAGMLLTPMCRSIIPLIICLGIILPAGTGAISYGIIVGIITAKIPSESAPAVLGVINASSGIGNTILSPVINTLIRTGGLMHGMIVLTVPVLLTLPTAFLMGKKDKAQTVEAKEIKQERLPDNEKMSISAMFGKAIKDRTYIFLMIGFLTCGFHMALITNHLPTQIQSFGFSSQATAYAFSIYGITTIIGSVLSGSECNKLKMKNVLGFFYGLRPITIMLFLVLPKTLFSVTFFTALFGFSGAATVPPVSGIINRAYGAKSIAILYGIVFVMHQIGGFFGAWLGGICFDATGSYVIIWTASAIFGLIASSVSFAIHEDKSMAVLQR